MTNIEQTINNFVTAIQPYVYLVVILGIVGCGGALAFGNKNDKVQDAKKYLLGSIGAALLIGAATTIAKWITDRMVF